jgi:hypothetical protein
LLLSIKTDEADSKNDGEATMLSNTDRFEDVYLMILWHVDPLLGNDQEISKYTAAVTE